MTAQKAHMHAGNEIIAAGDKEVSVSMETIYPEVYTEEEILISIGQLVDAKTTARHRAPVWRSDPPLVRIT